MGRLEALIWSCEDPCTVLLCYEKMSVRKTRQYVKERFVKQAKGVSCIKSFTVK